MAVIETWYDQDLQQPVKVHYLDGSMFSHNGKGNRIGVHVFNSGEPVTLSGTVSGYVVISDGSTVPCTGSRSGNSASILIPAAAYQPGSVFITLFITDGTTVTTLASVAASVLTARTDNQIDPGTVINDWTLTINAAMQSVETAAANLGGIIAVPYASITFPVPLGKYTYYNDNLYRCIFPIASSEEWTASHWTRVKLGDDVTNLANTVAQKADETEVADLKSAIDAVMDITLDESQISTAIYAGAMTSQKITYWGTGAYILAYIPCESGKAYHVTKDVDTTNFDIAYATAETLALNTPVYGFISLEGTERSALFVPGTGATFLIVQTKGSIRHVAISEYINRYDNEIVNINNNVDALNTIASETTKGEYIETDTTNIEPSLTFTTGYMAKNGSVQTGGITTLEYSNKIEVAPTNIIRSSGDDFRFVCAFNGNTAVSEKGAENTREYIVPEGIDHVVLTRYKSESGVAINLIETELHYTNIVKPIPMGYMSESGDMSDGDVISLLYHNVKNKNRYVFNANITTLGSIKFQKGTSYYITVSQSGIAIHNDQGTINVTFPEGFSITHDITLVVENDESIYLSKLTIESAGNVFNADVTTTPIRFLMDTGTPSIQSVGSVLTNCRFSWVSENVNAPIWIFGDSYVSWYDVRWVYYAAQDGNLKSTLLSGYAGEGSGDAMSGLKNLLKITTPKIVVWCLGMNNGDSDSAVNTAWLNNYNKLIELSEQYGFEIVLYTTPTTPTINNSFKNAIMRDSGYRYIEADLAVRIDAEGHWVTGALSGDNVHPTEIGAKILYYRFLADLPELMSRK